MNVRTTQGQQFIDITREVQKFVEQDGLQDGFVVVYVPHTTAAVTINENGDPAVVRDIIATLNKVFPVQGDYTHFEGNSHAHIKASLLGSSCTVPVENGSCSWVPGRASISANLTVPGSAKCTSKRCLADNKVNYQEAERVGPSFFCLSTLLYQGLVL